MKPHLALLLAPTLLLTACFNTTPVNDAARRFLPCPAPAKIEKIAATPSVGLREVRLPSYLDTVKIAVRTKGSELTFNDYNLWSDPLDKSAARTLAQQLRLRIGADRVDAFPWTDGVKHEVELRVQFDRFEGDADGSVHVNGRFILTKTPHGTEAATIVPFDYAGTWQTSDYATLAQTLGNDLDKLAADIAAKLAAK